MYSQVYKTIKSEIFITLIYKNVITPPYGLFCAGKVVC